MRRLPTVRFSVVKVRRIGHSLGFILPHRMAETLQLAQGDRLQLSARPGGLWLSVADPGFDRALAEFEGTRRYFRQTLRVLADIQPQAFQPESAAPK